MSGIDTTALINEVKIRPGIYNRYALTPPRKEHKLQLWLEVCERLTPPEEWQCCTDEEREMRSDVSRRWRNLRDIFYREVKLLESGDSNKKRKYVHFNEMEFLRPYIGYKCPPVNKRRKKSLDSVNSLKECYHDDTEIDMEEFFAPKKQVVGKKKKTQTILSSKTIPAIRKTPNLKQNKPSSSNSSVKVFKTECLIENFDIVKKSNNANNRKYNIRESDISFCLSLVPTLHKMSDVRKLSAKIDILKVLRKNMTESESNENNSKFQHNINNINIKQNSDNDDLIEKCDDSNNSKVWW